MKKSMFHPIRTRSVITSGIAVFCTTASISLMASDVQVARYSLLNATPSTAQVELLETTINVNFPERIQTVGEAIHYLLLRSGYRLARKEVIASDTKVLFSLPLPTVHQNLGPMKLRTALKILVGNTFVLIQDPVHRLITFERCKPKSNDPERLTENSDREVEQND